MHHLDSWIKIDQLYVTCFIILLFTAQHVLNVSTSIFRSLRLIVDLFHVLYCSVSMCVGVTVWFGWGGVVSLCKLKQCFSLHKDTTPPQPNHTVTPTHIETEQYNTWNKSTISRKLLKMDVLTFETCWAVNSELIKQVTSSWSILIQPILCREVFDVYCDNHTEHPVWQSVQFLKLTTGAACRT